MKLSFTDFKGLRPARAAHLLEPNEAQTADNCKLSRGTLKPWDGEATEKTLGSGEEIKTVYKYHGHWFEWTDDVDVVKGPVAADTTYRVYFTGDGYPKKTRYNEGTTAPVTAADTNWSRSVPPYKTYPIESPTPALTPTGVSAGGGSGDDREILYVYTLVTAWGEESAPSPVSAAVTAKNGDTVNITNITFERQDSTEYSFGSWTGEGEGGSGEGLLYKCITGGTSGVGNPFSTSDVPGDRITDGSVVWEAFNWEILDVDDDTFTKRIYRSNTSADSAAYQYVGDTVSTSYADSVEDDDLGDPLSTGDYGVPPTDLTNIVSLGSFFAGFSGKDIYFSEPNYPHAWPSKYVVTIDSEPVGMKVVGHTLVVATDDFPYLIYGTHPDSMTPEKQPEPYPCVSKRSMATWRETVFYATPHGAVQIVPGGRARMITDGYYDLEAWQALSPSTMHGAIRDDKYYLFYNTGVETEKGVLSDGTAGGLVIDLLTGVITNLDVYSTAEYVDETTGELYRVYSFESVLLQEDGTGYSSRSNIILAEDGNYLLVE